MWKLPGSVADRDVIRPTEKSWRKSLVPPPAVALPHTVVQRQKCCWRNAVRDEREFFVTRAWRRFCGTVSDRTAQSYSLDENRPSFRYGGQRGCGSEMSCGMRLAVRLLVFFCSPPACSNDEWSHLWSEWLLGSLWMPLPLLREYVRCHIGMTVLFAAHQSSVCLSVLYAEPHFHIESTPPTLISIW